MDDGWPRPEPAPAAKRIASLAMLGVNSGKQVLVWGGGLEGESAMWVGFEEETDVVSVQTINRMIHMPASQLIRVEVG